MYEEEVKRMRMFIERVCKMSQLKFIEEVNKELVRANPGAKTYNASEINKILSAKTLLPLAILKAMRKLWRLNYEWVFEGIGDMQVDRSNQRKISQDVTDILASMLVLESSVQSLKRTLDKVAGDFYAHKKGINKD